MDSPEWLDAPFDECHAYLDESRTLVLLSRYAVTELGAGDPSWLPDDYAGMPDEYSSVDEHMERANELQAIANLAKEEMRYDFPLLHAHSLVGIWGAMDSWIHDLLAAWLSAVPESYSQLADFLGNAKGQVRVKVDVRSLLYGDRQAVACTVVDAIDAALKDKHDRSKGVSWFESRLSAVGLVPGVGDLPDSTALLFPLEIIRHTYAHSSGHPEDGDVALLGSYGHSLRNGRVMIGADAYEAYASACDEYVDHVRSRCLAALTELRAED